MRGFTLLHFNADGCLDATFDASTTLDGTPAYTAGGAAVVLDTDARSRDERCPNSPVTSQAQASRSRAAAGPVRETSIPQNPAEPSAC